MRNVTQWNPGEVPLATVAHQIADGEWHVAVEGDMIVGALRLLWSDRSVWHERNTFAAYVHGLMVPRKHAGRGLGTALLWWAEGQARLRNAPALRLDCVESNTRLRAYYQELGFTEVGRLERDGPWYSAVLLEKRLATHTP